MRDVIFFVIQVCVEWDEKSWECREWLHLHQLSNVLIEKHFTILKHSIGNGVSSALVSLAIM